MYLDNFWLCGENQDLAQVAGTYQSTNSVDLGTGFREVGTGNPLHCFCQVTETVTSGAAATIVARLIESANADLSSGDVVMQTPAIELATMVAGYKFRLGSVPPGTVLKRYLGYEFVIGTATTTAGTITSGFVWDLQTGD